MILAAGLLVLAGPRTVRRGILTGATALYWGCVAACVVAAVLLFPARRRTAAPGPRPPAPARRRARAPRGGDAAPAGDGTPRRRPPARGTAGRPSAAAEPPAEPRRPPPPEPAPRRTCADPPVEEVEVTDLLLVVDLKDEVLVVDEHPRYHLAGCRLAGRDDDPAPDRRGPDRRLHPVRGLRARPHPRRAGAADGRPAG